MSLKYVVEVFKLASKEVLGDYLSLEKFIKLEKHLKSKTLNSEDTINLLNPKDIEFFIKVSKLAKARYFNDIEDVLTNLLFPYQDILKEISKYNNSYDKIIKFKILDRELFEEFCQIIESKEYKDSAWFEIYNLKTKITYEEIIKNLQELKGKIIEVLHKFNKIDVCNIKHFEYKNELWVNVDTADSVFTSESWENKKLITQSTLPNKSIIFVLNQGEKSFKMHTGSGKRFSKAMQEAFFKVNLKEDSVSNNFQASYDIQKIYLDILKNTNPFPKMIESEIKALFVNRIILENQNENHPFTPALKNKKTNEGMYDIIIKHGLTKKLNNTEIIEGERWTAEKVFFTCIYGSNNYYKFFSINSKNDISLGNDEMGIKIRNLLRKNEI